MLPGHWINLTEWLRLTSGRSPDSGCRFARSRPPTRLGASCGTVTRRAMSGHEPIIRHIVLHLGAILAHGILVGPGFLSDRTGAVQTDGEEAPLVYTWEACDGSAASDDETGHGGGTAGHRGRDVQGERAWGAPASGRRGVQRRPALSNTA